MTVADFHSHILPGLDDGSASVEESIALLQMEAAQGIAHIIATPHFYPQYDDPEKFLEKRKQAMARLQTRMDNGDGFPQITLGAEVYFFRGMSQSEQIRHLTIGNSNYLLIEMPPSPWTEEIFRELEEIYRDQGIVPIIAHIERYISPMRTYGILKRLAGMPILIQANAEFFTNKRTAGMALRLLKEGRIHLLGTDCHNMISRKPNLDSAVQLIMRKLGESALRKINNYEEAVLMQCSRG